MVSTNLLPGLITLHMLLAVLIVFVIIYAVARHRPVLSEKMIPSASRSVHYWLIGAIILSVVQVALGTQVREAIDEIARQLGEARRDSWVNNLGISFYIHRSFSLLVLFVHGYLIYRLQQNNFYKNKIIHKNIVFLLVLLILEILSGVGMAYFNIPAFLQPLHLLLAIIVIRYTVLHPFSIEPTPAFTGEPKS
ncbi:MAG: hypothetical protein HC880_09750 [Bacteroidia bacterium]|nr:hypothetical protein [Bacteroidia bacterium]